MTISIHDSITGNPALDGLIGIAAGVALLIIIFAIQEWLK